MNYRNKLRDPRWQRKRLQIMERDGWACVECGDSTSTLVVHHRYYERAREPWDYPSDALDALCERCHELEGRSGGIADSVYSMLRRLGVSRRRLRAMVGLAPIARKVAATSATSGLDSRPVAVAVPLTENLSLTFSTIPDDPWKLVVNALQRERPAIFFRLAHSSPLEISADHMRVKVVGREAAAKLMEPATRSMVESTIERVYGTRRAFIAEPPKENSKCQSR